MDPKTKKWLRLLSAVILLALVTAGLYFLVGRPMIRFVSEPEKFRAWVDSHGFWGRLSFLAMVVFQILVAVIPGEPFEMAAGYAFGAWEGTALCLLGAAVGSILTFLLVRHWGLRIVELFFKKEDLEKLRFLKTDSRRNMLFLIIYIMPGTPKDLLGYFAGLTDMRLTAWLLICSFGRIPSVVTSTLCGDALGTRNYVLAGIVLAVTLAVSAAGLFAYEWICRKRKIEEEHNEKTA